jgi:competence protein ComGC
MWNKIRDYADKVGLLLMMPILFIIGALMIIFVPSPDEITRNYSEIDDVQYFDIQIIIQKYPQLKPTVRTYLEDGKIIGQEYQEITTLSKNIKSSQRKQQLIEKL